MANRKKLGTGANDIATYQPQEEAIAGQSPSNDDFDGQSLPKSDASFKISLRLKPNEHLYFSRAQKLSNTSLAAEIHRALAEYMRHHPL